MSFLYVVEAYATLRFENGQVIAEKNGVKTYIPIETLEGVVCIGNINLTAPCMKEMLKRDLPVTFLSSRGVYFGRLDSTKKDNIHKQRLQFQRGEDPAFRLALSKRFILAKINNQVVYLRRCHRERPVPEVAVLIEDMKKLFPKVKEAATIEQVMGYEGNVARMYFKALSFFVSPPFSFDKRTRMPPKDSFNSLLSLCYTLLFYEIYTVVINKGFSAFAGFLHSDRNKHPALVSDLMEEWRSVIVDPLVLSLVNSGKLTQEDFTLDESSGGVFIGDNALKMTIQEFETKLNKMHNYDTELTYKVSFRKSFDLQLNHLQNALTQQDAKQYHPIFIR